MTELYSNIQALCMQNGITVTKMCSDLNITRSALSELSSGRTKQLSYENLFAISEYFGVEISFFSEKNNSYCPQCGSEWGNKHDKWHADWKKAVNYFGFCWNTLYRNEVKAKARYGLRDIAGKTN